MKIVIEIEYPVHETVILTNKSGDTYTSKSEAFIDFLEGADNFQNIKDKYDKIEKSFRRLVKSEFGEDIAAQMILEDAGLED